MPTESARKESFLSTNICPQVGAGFNRTYWAKLEGFTRSLLSRFDDVHVVTGPLYLPLTKNGDARLDCLFLDGTLVPTHFFKVILGIKGNKHYMGAF